MLRKRGLCLLLALSLSGAYLLTVLFRMQVFGYETAQQDVLDEITVGSVLKADRGLITDRSGHVLAESKTVYRIYISPVDIQSVKRKTGRPADEEIARGLSAITGVSYETIYRRSGHGGRLDETVLRGADRETARAALAFASENGLLSMVHVEATVSRYYPFSDLAAQVIGFTGSDNRGLFGLEAYYDEYLSGTDGQYVTAKDASGKDMPLGYSGYRPATDGATLTTTLDLYIQTQLERVLAAAADDAGAVNRVTGIVMDVRTGGILAMATLPSYDLNDPYTLDEASLSLLAAYTPGSEEYDRKKTELLYTMWRNKAITETYEPGSTFKIVTSAMGLETGAVRPEDRFSCSGAYVVGGVTIHCHKRTGHGPLSFAEGLQQSCNPVFMQVAARVGAAAFYQYVGRFGYLEKTGIDLPGETGSIFHTESALHEVELATAAFGQRFNVSLIQQLTAVAAVANGGSLIRPHLIDRITAADGTVLTQAEPEIIRQTVSAETCTTVSAILEAGVAGGGGARNAHVCGYRIAAKTGTSEKLNGGRVGSCVAYAPADAPRVAVILAVDEPTSYIKYGSTVAAPYVGDLLENVLPYLGVEPVYTAEEEKTCAIPVGNYVGLSRAEAAEKIRDSGLSVVYGDDGTGDTVITQIPAAGTAVTKEGGHVILYTGSAPRASVKVPKIVGLPASEANRAILDAGLNIRITGARDYALAPGAVAVAVSHEAGEYLPPGTVVTVTFRYLTSDEDG